MWPPSPWRRMRGTNVRMPLMTPLILTSITQSQSERGISSSGTPSMETPALLHTVWIGRLVDRGRRLFQQHRIRYVGDEGLHVSAEIVQACARLRQRLGANVDHRDICAGLCECGRDAETDAGCSTRHVRGLSLEILHALTPCSIR